MLPTAGCSDAPLLPPSIPQGQVGGRGEGPFPPHLPCGGEPPTRPSGPAPPTQDQSLSVCGDVPVDTARPTLTPQARGARTLAAPGQAGVVPVAPCRGLTARPSAGSATCHPRYHIPPARPSSRTTDRWTGQTRGNGTGCAQGLCPAWSSRKPVLKSLEAQEDLPDGDSTGQQTGGRQAAPGVTARMAHGTRRAGMDRTTRLVKCSALEPLPGAGGTSGRRPRELGGRHMGCGRAALCPASPGRERAGQGHCPVVPRPWCCLKNWRPLARVCDRAPWARRAFEAQLLRVQDGVRSLARWGRRICSRGALFGSDLCRRASAKPATGKATWGFPRPGRPLPMSGPGTEDTGRPVSCGSRGLCALGCP